MSQQMIAHGFIVTLIFVSSFAKAQNAEISYKGQEKDQEFSERLDDFGRVSGDIIMGVMIGAIRPNDAEDVILADIAPRVAPHIAAPLLIGLTAVASEPGTQDFCVRINSKDGRFEAENTYAVPKQLTVPQVSFIYGGKFAPDLMEMNAVSLVKAGQCGTRTEVVVPSTWAERPILDAPKALHIFVNSAGNPTDVAFGKGADYVACDDIAEASTLKYTAVCILPYASLEAQQENGLVELTFYVARSLGEEVFDLAVLLPPFEG